MALASESAETVAPRRFCDQGTGRVSETRARGGREREGGSKGKTVEKVRPGSGGTEIEGRLGAACFGQRKCRNGGSSRLWSWSHGEREQWRAVKASRGRQRKNEREAVKGSKGLKRAVNSRARDGDTQGGSKVPKRRLSNMGRKREGDSDHRK